MVSHFIFLLLSYNFLNKRKKKKNEEVCANLLFAFYSITSIENGIEHYFDIDEMLELNPCIKSHEIYIYIYIYI
jgi:hypothetical protein